MAALTTKRVGIALALSGSLIGSAAVGSFGDDTPRIGRLFRLGGNSRPADASTIGKPGSNTPNSDGAPRPFSPHAPNVNPSGDANASAGARIKPQARVSRAVTEAEPLVSRVSIGRSDDGKQFCMFIEIFADGTILDSEGVHHVGPDHLRGIAQILQSGELAKLKGHCGGPAADFIEQHHMVSYDRFHGRLRATPFSYSGNPQGCDPAVKKMNDAIDAIQMKLSGPPVTRSAGANEATPSPIPTPTAGPESAPVRGSLPIGLTPEHDRP
jgi:hypothetical protein